jgi:hypothetical protein
MMTYTCATTDYTNSGLGWEPTALIQPRRAEVRTKADCAEFAAQNGGEGTTVKVYDEFGDLLASTNLHGTRLYWA